MQVKQPTQANVEYVIYLQDHLHTALYEQKYKEGQVSKLSLKIC